MGKWKQDHHIIGGLEAELDDCKYENSEMSDALNEIANLVGHGKEGANPVVGRVSDMVKRHDVMEVALVRLSTFYGSDSAVRKIAAEALRGDKKP